MSLREFAPKSWGFGPKRWLGRSKRERRLRTASVLAILAGSLFIVWILLSDPMGSVQLVLADALFSEDEGSPNIVIVSIDDEALGTHGRIQEWPRSLHADAIRNLSQAGARVIVYDILFADRGVADEALADAIAQSRNVLLPVAGGGSSSASEGHLIYESFSLPVDPLREAGAFVGHVNVLTDTDGKVRLLPLAVRDQDGNQYPALSVAAMSLQFERTPPDTFDFADDTLDLFGRTVPVEQHSALRINYIGGIDQFPHLRFDDVLEGRFDPSLVRNKVVLVGITATATDIHSAPLLEQASGMEIHANALDTLLRARFLRPAGGWVNLITLVGMVMGAGILLPRLRVGLGVVAVLATTAVYLVTGAYMFKQGYILDFVDPPAALVLLMVVALAYRAVSERASQRELQELFGRYVSPEVAIELVGRADRGELRLGGELREVTVMFADLRGFTALAERMEPAQLVDLLNIHFDVIVSEVINHQGIVNKFAGDAVMALWNAPKEQTDHAFLACCAAIEAQRRLEPLAPSEHVARFGFGIDSGIALAGNVGAVGRLEYTVIGDAVNLAARLSDAAGPGEIWVSDQTFRLVQDRLTGELLPPQHLKGFEAPVSIFAIRWDVSQPAVEAGV